MKRLLITLILIGGVASSQSVYAYSGVTQDISNMIISDTTKIEVISKKLADLNAQNLDRLTYIKQYKEIMADALDPPETPYNIYTQDDIDLFAKLVEAEATAGDFDNKCNVASVVWNRLNSGEHGDTLRDVIMEDNPIQFSPIADGRINTVTVTDEDYLAIEYTFEIADTTAGSLYFDNVNGETWASRNREYVFTDSINHSFYK